MAKEPTSGQSRGINLRDENGDGYGVKRTGNVPHVIIESMPSASGVATEAKQDALYSLVETLNELSARLQVLGSMANSGSPALRITPIATIAVSGPLTSAQHLSNELTKRQAIENLTAIHSNIVNVTGV